MIVLIDSREQLRLWHPSENAVVQKLDEGDYTTEKLKDIVHAERKSPGDLYNSIMGGHVRFRNMLVRAVEKGINLTIFVECPRKTFMNKTWNKQAEKFKTSPKTLEKTIITISHKYDVAFVWCNGREHMKAEMLEWFWQCEKQLEEQHATMEES